MCSFNLERKINMIVEDVPDVYYVKGLIYSKQEEWKEAKRNVLMAIDIKHACRAFSKLKLENLVQLCDKNLET
jgi:O-phosphoseryl-tRNA(Cys) synthetase